ncbi:MAG: PDZ domain-containing protein, partial [Syntrophomonadaceae bacterium]|nr:PDZ domain-containing protein [Syntrophomonadaceae bacterium]
MRKSKVLRGLNIFFATLGVLVVAGLLFIFITNSTGLGTLASVIGLVKTQALYDIHTPNIIEGATSGVVDALDDPYSKYLDKKTWKDLKERLEAEFGGIGVYVLQDREGRLKVVSPIKGTPAYKEGIKDGDIIIRINGESTMGMTQDDAVHLMRGDPGTQLVLGVYREAANQEYDFKIIREVINIPSVEAKTLDSAGQIGYIRLNQFHS